MTGNPEKSLTIDTHHHILPDFFWQATENAHAPVWRACAASMVQGSKHLIHG
jgi:hypothetical protein